MFGAVTDVAGIKVGHYTDKQAITGCTVILCESGAVAGVDVSGSSPGTRETDLLRPGNLVENVHAILLSGGSAFGLDAAAGVMKYLEERGFGYETSAGRVPIVPAAIMFDLNIGDSKIRPGANEGYQACLAATDAGVTEGCVGAGTGATVGKILGIERAVKSGLGTASQKITGDVVVAALIVVNAVGDVIEPGVGAILAGPRRPDGGGFLSTSELWKGELKEAVPPFNTVIGVVATDAKLSKAEAGRLARMAQVGIARTIDPCHTMYDGDALFALSSGEKKADISALGAAAAEVVAEAIVRAIRKAETLAGVPAAKDINKC
ncbi:MAG TPA: peptidase S58 family protein [Chloroflexi bacterium]|nr:peptidase S58 family protein [Chloroflexota bacterium]